MEDPATNDGPTYDAATIGKLRANQKFDFPGQEEISLYDIMGILMRRWFLILVIAIFGSSIGLIAAFTVSPEYFANSVLSPIGNKNTPTVEAGSLGRLAAVAGVNLGGGGDASTNEVVASIQSRRFAEHFIIKHDLLPLLFPNNWDTTTQVWRKGSNTVSLLGRVSVWLKTTLNEWFDAPHLLRELEENEIRRKSAAPTLDEGVLKLLKISSVSINKDNYLVEISILWHDAQQASDWVNSIVVDINNQMSANALREANRDLAYLERELQNTRIAEMRKTLYSLIEKTIKKKMLAKGRKGFVLKVIDPASPPIVRAKPNRAIFFLAGTFLGIGAGIFLVLFLNAIKAVRARPARAVN